MERTKIVIAITGGVLQSVQSNFEDVDVVLVDADDLRESGKSDAQIDKIWDKATKNCPFNVY